MFSDSAALLVAVIAARMALKPPGAKHSYGFARAEVIAASFNGLLLLGIVVMIVVEAIQRLQQPQPVSGLGVLIVAFFGLLINITVLRILGHGEHNLNTRAARLHVIGDLFGSIAALTAGAVGAGKAVGVLRSGWLEGHSGGDHRNQQRCRIREHMPGVDSVHDLHVWAIASGQIALSAHVDVDTLDNWPATLERIRSVARSRFGIEHVTIQPELVGGINPEREVVIPIVPTDSGEAT
jgi:cobalt-zinc-cadmium efflux system protein